MAKRIKDAQPHLPGMSPKRDNVLHKCAEAFADARHQATAARKKQNEAEQKLIDKMIERKVKDYHFDNVEVHRSQEDKINCRIKDAKGEETEE